ncbi:hypothetical protein QVD17_37367 [Tagetes erecta]|uniref:Wall-associated receptor kinase galacturonan-binding domain-containing protein n=1 Tax=Tagetes erecta TaxID=13708 RepID=A0AAD8JWI6_TARER|nr:hypothetical protein QVD17_37367 [Tagetes erecta]
MKIFLSYMHLLIFLSLTVTSPATAKFSKTGCRDTCGNVTIPYPFGIGVKCSINKWYIVECNSSTPYLPALNYLEVFSVNLENQTVTLNTPRIIDCQNTNRDISEIMGLNLGKSPFLFSKSHNIFVFKGCGIATMMDGGSVLTGCSTSCLNVTQADLNNCYGIGCCQTAIPSYLKSYSIKTTGLGDDEEACGSAFLVDKTLFDQGWFSNKNTSFIPISLLWTLSDSDQVTCCANGPLRRRRVNMLNGTPVDTLKCDYFAPDNPYLRDGCREPITIAKYAKDGCIDMCGNVKIPFPFGFGANCSANQWYIVDCDSSLPYLPALNHLQLLGVDLENQIVSVSIPRISHCQKPFPNISQMVSINLGGSPFLFSKLHNKFVFEGCGIAAMMDKGSVITACSTTCRNVTLSDKHNCFGIGCCQTTIPHYLSSYSINLTGLEGGTRACGSAFLTNDASYEQGTFSDPFISVSLMWTLAEESDQVTCCTHTNPDRFTVDVFNGTSVVTSKCYNNSPIVGNPFLLDGCMYNFDNAFVY